ncbi:MAG: endonuclease MutS2 [Oscillospiraceae bacterium]|nr:endonuclease MutS2 [Oscillospiraceae bacterium]
MNQQTEVKQKYLHALELDKILHMVAQHGSCEDSRVLAQSLQPATDLERAQHLLTETDDAYILMARFGAPSFHGLVNIVNPVRRAEAGGVLNLTELLRIRSVLQVLKNVVKWRSKSEGMKTSLDPRFGNLQPNQYLENRIGLTVLSEEEVADTASPELQSIRRRIQRAEAKAREHLDALIHSLTKQKYLQEQIVTMRSGRYVVPVKAEYRSEIPGLVHDTSSSGATVFVEPMSVVEANNEIRVLQAEEKEEIERILTALSAEVGSFAGELCTGYRMAVELDLIFAKASLAYEMKATMPKLNDQGRILLRQSRHPLIDSKKVVPTDISLGIDFDTLIITGPNTGGKTVALKTTGLLCAMAMCGLMLPVAQESEVSVFDQILVDIGDEQSIEQSLSTFSAHMTNQISILKNADAHSLVLMDEVGAGTDPIEGAALGIAIIEELRQKGARIGVTTHYAELKEFALQTDGVENGCCEFDVATLRPTYRLLIGVPGRSNAFAISLKLGIEPSIIDRAKELVSAENSRFETVVESLEEQRQSLERERQEAQALRQKAQSLVEEAQAEKERSAQYAAKELEVAQRQASNLVSRTRAQIDSLMDELEAVKKEKHLSSVQKMQINSRLRNLEQTADPVRQRKKGVYTLPRPLKVGDTVLIFDIDKKGIVTEIPAGGDPVTVQAGIVKTRVPLSNLRLLEEEQVKVPKRTVTKRVSTGSARGGSMSELDLRGETVLDALLDVDRFLDSAQLNGLNQVTIIHGKGTGALRKAVQDHLKRHSAVKSYRLGVFGEGESGVTIVELKK